MQIANRTRSLKESEIEHKWLLLDAENAIPGRLAALAARLLRGKHKPNYTPHMDCGDYVVIINAAKIAFTGRKRADKIYYRHTGYPGGIRQTSPEKVLAGDRPERVLEQAVRRMMPRGPLARQQMTHLKLYGGDEHPHAGQNPQVIDFKALNAKNRFRSAVGAARA